MEVLLPSSGCNIFTSDSTFYNYHDDGHTRDTYIVYDGQILLSGTQTSQYGYSYNGTCVKTGDIYYKPEYHDFIFPLTSIFCALTIFYLAYRLIVHHWWRRP